jgi:hypothetical protein
MDGATGEDVAPQVNRFEEIQALLDKIQINFISYHLIQ